MSHTRLLPPLLLMTLLAQGFADNQVTASKSESKSSCVHAAPILETKAGYFFFSDSKMRKIYNKGGLDVQITGVYPVWRCLQIYGSVEYLQRHGRSLNSGHKTWIWQLPLNLGLRPVFKVSPKARYYFTLGPRYVFAYVKNRSSDLDRNMHQNGLGGFVNTGFLFFPRKNFFIDIFGEYSYVKLRFHHSKSNVYSKPTQVGGYTFGGGLGYAF